MVPPVRRDALQRARLAPLRRAARRSRVLLVSAPAGYGKSTLAAQWSDADSRPVGWVQLSHGDNDPVVLLARVAAALERTGSASDELLEELSRRSPRIDEVVLPLLAADLGERVPFVLVLDDVDVITGQKSRAILAFLADQVRIRLATRAGVARQSGSAARPPACRRGSVRDRQRRPRAGREGDPRRCC